MNKPQHIKPGDFLLGAGVIITLGVVAIAAARNQPRDWEGEATQDLRRLARAYNLYAEAYDGGLPRNTRQLGVRYRLEGWKDNVGDPRYTPTSFTSDLYVLGRHELSLWAEPLTGGHFTFNPHVDYVISSPIQRNQTTEHRSGVFFGICGRAPQMTNNLTRSSERLVVFQDERVAWQRGSTPYQKEVGACIWEAVRKRKEHNARR